MKLSKILPACTFGAAMTAAAGSSLYAQSEQTAPPVASTGQAPVAAEAQGNVIQEIVVTAQKRSENINSVGMAITANTGAQLAQKGVISVSDLVKIEPSLQFSETQSGTPVFTLRGVGYFEQSLSASPTVSIYQDEVAFPYPVMSRGVLLDPARVEILKGPQGTLYGQNATGGAINFIAAPPTETFHAGFDESYGRFNDNLLSGFVSGPLTPTLSARLSGSIEEGGAWQKSDTRNDTLGDKDTQIGRLLLTWRPTDELNAALNVNGWEDHSQTQAGQLEGYRLQAPQNIGPGSLNNPATYIPAPVGSPAFNAYPAPLQSVYAQPTAPNNARAADWDPGTHPHNDETFVQTDLRIDYQLIDSIGLTSLSNFEHFTESNQVDAGGVGAPEYFALIQGKVTTYSQELRLHGDFPGTRGNWLVGANYESDESKENDLVDPYFSSASYSPTLFGLLPFFQFNGIGNSDVKTSSAFANADYPVLDTINLHAGIRYTRSDQNLSGCSAIAGDSGVPIIQSLVGAELAAAAGGHSGPGVAGQCVTLGPAPNFIPGLVANTLNQSNVPFRVGIDWTPIEHNLIYFTVSKGFKAGSSPVLGASRAAQLTPVNQESLLSFEVGSKSELLDRTLQINTAFFHYDYTDKQELGRLLDPIYGALQTLINIPKSTENGAELSTVWQPTRNLTFNFAATYLDSRVTSSFYDTGPYPLGPSNLTNFKGEPFPYTPKWSLQSGARFDWNLTNDLRAFVSADGQYQTSSTAAFGSEEAAADGAPPLMIKAYGTLNLTAGISPANGPWRFELWGKNVTNTYYWTSVNYVSDTVVRFAGMPTTYGLRVSYRY